MTAALRDITIEVGAAKQVDFSWSNAQGVPFDLTNYGARMQVRKTVQEPTAPVTLTHLNGGITFDLAHPGRFSVHFSQADTTAIAAAMRFGVYDLWLDPDGIPSSNSRRLVAGEIKIVLPVTR